MHILKEIDHKNYIGYTRESFVRGYERLFLLFFRPDTPIKIQVLDYFNQEQ